MEAAKALADLAEISSQIESVVLVDAKGAVVATTLGDAARADAFASSVRSLLAQAEQASGAPESRERLVQLQAVTPEGCVFVVQDEERLIAAVTVPEPTVGLVFYDLKTCLRHVAGEELAPKPRPRAGSKKAENDEG